LRHRRDATCGTESGRHQTGKTRDSAIDERTTQHAGYGMSRSRRAIVECIFEGKQHGTMRKIKHRGSPVAADLPPNLIAYRLICIPNCLS